MTPCRSRTEFRIIPARAGFTMAQAEREVLTRDHPRSRGVYIVHRPPTPRLSGSSPLARGLRTRCHRGAGRPGIIPARAGFTCWPCRWMTGAADHPRSRGVYVSHQQRVKGSYGSSPLARGLRATRPLRGSATRIIPARAGFTAWCPTSSSGSPDHPRSRGVYGVSSASSPASTGSSPLARGLPARSSRSPTTWTDHPRSRGVYSVSSSKRLWGTGSSPLARGLHPTAVSGDWEVGIIPARAGFTCVAGCGRAGREDHPRSRGVYSSGVSMRKRTSGSSPLARGLPRRGFLKGYEAGIIPARAGFT